MQVKSPDIKTARCQQYIQKGFEKAVAKAMWAQWVKDVSQKVRVADFLPCHAQSFKRAIVI